MVRERTSTPLLNSMLHREEIYNKVFTIFLAQEIYLAYLCIMILTEEQIKRLREEFKGMSFLEVCEALTWWKGYRNQLSMQFPSENEELSSEDLLKTELSHIGAVIESMVGKQFKHRNGNIYTVLLLTNTDSTPERLKDHPIDVVYMGQNGKIWSRKLDDWDRSFTYAKRDGVVNDEAGQWGDTVTITHEGQPYTFSYKEFQEYYKNQGGINV